MAATVRDNTDLVAAGLIRGFRRKMGWTQEEMSRVTGLPQSLLNAYETGSRQPSVGALIRLFEACGKELHFNVADRDRHDELLPLRSNPAMLAALEEDNRRRREDAPYPEARRTP